MKLKIITLVLLIISLNVFAGYKDYIYSDKNVSYNSFGQAGLIYLPSADQKEEADVSFTLSRNNIWKMGTITVTPFNWLEASYFYYRPEDIYWGNKLGLYLDKGFNLKFSYKPRNKSLPTIAIGLDDFAGTGLFTREYLVTTFDLEYLKLTSGIGWGKYANKNTFTNPLSFISDSFLTRQENSSQYSLGGKPSYDTWFKGEAALFAGIEYFIPYAKGAKFKIEYEPFNYFNFGIYDPIDLSQELRKKDSNLNFGISMPYKYGNFDISYIKGNTLNLSFSTGLNFSKVRKNKNFEPKIKKNYKTYSNKNNFYNDLLANLNNNKIYLQTANITKDNVELTVESPNLSNNISSSYRAALITNKVAKLHDYKFNKISVGHLLSGMQINNISYLSDDLKHSSLIKKYELKRNALIEDPDSSGYTSHEFKPIVQFPVVFKNISPVIRSHVGSPEKFYYGGLSLSAAVEVQFSRNLVLNSIIGYSLIDNFDDKESQPDSLLPNVRTDIVRYLQTKKYIEKLSLDYFSSPFKNVYTKYSAGILELMYSGYGAEILYKPFDKNFMIGYESYKVSRRDYKLITGTLDYEVKTNHLNLVYQSPLTGLRLKYSYGNYLARDNGYTFDFSRATKSGFRAGFFFSRTNIPEELFGEGSFDKGFYFSFPTDIFSQDRSKSSQGFGIKTLTRDGGQKLIIDNNLVDYIQNATNSDLKRGWNEF